MRHRHAWVPVFVALGCSARSSDTAVSLSVPSLVVPQSLLRRIAQVNVDIAPLAPGVQCDPGTGQITGGASPAQYLATPDCSDGSPFCLDVDLGPSPTEFVVAARGNEAGGELYATACATMNIAQDKALSLTLQRAALVKSCGDQVLQLGEQCEAPGTRPLSCTSGCESRAVQLASVPARPASTFAAAWPSGQAPFLASYLSDSGSLCDAALDADFERQSLGSPFASGNACVPLPSGTQDAQLFRTTSGFRALYLTAASRLHTSEWSAALSPVDSGQPVSGTSGGPDKAFSAAVSGDVVFAVWLNGTNGLSGRTVTAGVLGPQRLYSDTGDVLAPRVAAWRDGWVLVWESAGTIRLRLLSPDGTPRGADVRVNSSSLTAASSKPDVAALPDGRFIITWESGGDIWAQRYGANGAAEPNNQAEPINDRRTAPVRNDVRVAAGLGQVPFFAVAWRRGTGTVEARLLGPSTGFLLNSVDGTDNEFSVVQDDGKTRNAHSLAIGGASPTLGIAWQQSEGVFARRFPLPTR